MTYILDDKAKFPGTNPSIEEYTRACSDAVDEALEKWPISETTKNGIVSTGFIGNNKLRSTLWTQSFEVSSKENDDSGNPSLEDLLSTLNDIFSSDDLEKHATQWDATFAGASTVGKLSENDETILVHWKFNASPLGARDLLYLIHRLEEEVEKDDADNKNGNRVRRLTYAYASVSDEWVKENTGKEIDYKVQNDGVKRVRAFNCFPSCDRITVYSDGQSSSGTKITVDHLLSPDLGGSVGPFMFNNFFKKALIQANAHECEAMREYALSLCK